MSLKKPENNVDSPRSAFRKSIQMLLVASFFTFQPADTTSKTAPDESPAEENYDYLLRGIEVVPDGTIKEEPSPANSTIPDDPDCTIETCIPA